jgi:hypothetical protein
MQLSKPVAVLVLIVTLVPIGYFAFFMVTVLSGVLGLLQGEDGKTWFLVLFVLHVLCILWIWALLALYLVFLFKSETVPKDKTVLWAVVLFFGNVLAMPIFWYLYMWRATSKLPPAEQPVA